MTADLLLIGRRLETPSEPGYYQRQLGLKGLWLKFRESRDLVGAFSVLLNESTREIHDLCARAGKTTLWKFFTIAQAFYA
jgi:hypothetical protein